MKISRFGILIFIVFVLASCIKKIKYNQVKSEDMVLVESGEFIFGSNDSTDNVNSNLIKKLFVDAFYISKYELTNEKFTEFIKSGGYLKKKYWDNDGWKFINENKITTPNNWNEDITTSSYQNFPVSGISWYEASAFAKWSGGRLPTEEEWEKAARGTDGRNYPWGNNFDKLLCNTQEFGLSDVLPVGFLAEGRSPYNIMDMCGNVEEWTDTRVAGLDYEYKEKFFIVIKGGSWKGSGNGAMAWKRYFFMPMIRGEYFGFRLAKDI